MVVSFMEFITNRDKIECENGTIQFHNQNTIKSEDSDSLVIQDKDFSYTSFREVTFVNCEFINCKFDRATFDKIQFLYKCKFTGCSFKNTVFHQVITTKHTIFQRNDFDTALFDNCSVKGSLIKDNSISNAVLTNTVFTAHAFDSNSFKNSHLNKVYFTHTDCVDCDFENTVFERTDFIDSHVSKSNINMARDLSGITAIRSQIEKNFQQIIFGETKVCYLPSSDRCWGNLGEGTLDEVRERNPKSIVVSLIFKFFGDLRDALNETEANDEKSYN